MTARYCVRVYPDGSAMCTVRDDEGVDSWLTHNREFRPNSALFVDGRLSGEDEGRLSPAAVSSIEATLAAEFAEGAIDLTVQDRIGLQKERLGAGWDRWTGYPRERERRSFAIQDAGPPQGAVDLPVSLMAASNASGENPSASA